MARKLTYDKNMNNDVILCRTYNELAGKHACRHLLNESISYSKSWMHIPFFLRSRFKGHSEVCIISINRNDYHTARRALDDLEPRIRRRLAVNHLYAV
ncbi:MAG: hypothetical protein VZR31_04845 [Lachnospiraceae bacterium]|jgi:hypothetical protein|nr:hypothetical protein [Lachnospiraceae bacterium]